jgi:toxin ParE1/3/4
VNFEIVWSTRALRRLNAIRVFVAEDKPVAAESLALRIVNVTESLKMHPDLGRRGTKTGLRELIVADTPYLVVYRVRGKRVVLQLYGTRLNEEVGEKKGRPKGGHPFSFIPQ